MHSSITVTSWIVTWQYVLTGAILTKMDGDSRGGAALSVKAVSGKPIKFVGAGEKLEALEPFYPDRLTSRILGKQVLHDCLMSAPYVSVRAKQHHSFLRRVACYDESLPIFSALSIMRTFL